MISDRMRNDAPFGVVLIQEGREAGPATTFGVGTLARITDFYQGSDGLLGVTAIGQQRFRIVSTERQADGLNVAEVELLPDEAPLALPDAYQPLAKILDGVLDDLGKLYEGLERRLDDAAWVSNRFIEILPIDLGQKQQCLESFGPLQRLELVQGVLNAVTTSADSGEPGDPEQGSA